MPEPRAKRPKRKGVADFDVAAAARLKNGGGGEGAAVPAEEPYLSNAVNLKESTWRLLREAANKYAETHGGRRSASAVIQRLIDRHRDELKS